MCNQNQDNTQHNLPLLYVVCLLRFRRRRIIIIVTVLLFFYYLTWVIFLKLIKQQTKHLHIWEAIKLHRCRRHKKYAVHMVLCNNNNNNNNKHRQKQYSFVILFFNRFSFTFANQCSDLNETANNVSCACAVHYVCSTVIVISTSPCRFIMTIL